MFIKNLYFYIVIIFFIFCSANCFVDSNDLPYKEGELLVRFAPKAEGIQQTVIAYGDSAPD